MTESGKPSDSSGSVRRRRLLQGMGAVAGGSMLGAQIFPGRAAASPTPPAGVRLNGPA